MYPFAVAAFTTANAGNDDPVGTAVQAEGTPPVTVDG